MLKKGNGLYFRLLAVVLAGVMVLGDCIIPVSAAENDVQEIVLETEDAGAADISADGSLGDEISADTGAEADLAAEDAEAGAEGALDTAETVIEETGAESVVSGEAEASNAGREVAAEDDASGDVDAGTEASDADGEAAVVAVDSAAEDVNEVVSEEIPVTAEPDETAFDTAIPAGGAMAEGEESLSIAEENNILLQEEFEETEEILTASLEESNNINAQDYRTYGKIIKSYLVALGNNNYMRVEAVGSTVVIQYYDTGAFVPGKKKEINLKSGYVFGGFYAGDHAYYLVQGQSNESDSESQIVLRVDKYDLEWDLLATETMKGMNTSMPFEAGSLRMTEYGGYLYIRTCHKMFKSKDGLKHQANWTLQIRESDMVTMDADYSVSNVGSGYVSHSFNQFIIVDDDKNIVALDHGDAYPRGAVLGRYSKKAGGESFNGTYAYKNIMAYEGDVGANKTGATLGGLEYSDFYYLTAGTTVERGDGWSSRSIYNVYLTKTFKEDLSGTRTVMVTDYKEGGKVSATTPHLVKVNNNKFLLLWGQTGELGEGKLSYVWLDGEGNQTSDIYTQKGYLSDCRPIVTDNYIIWYATKKGKTAFYLIDYQGKMSASLDLTKDGDEDDKGGTGDYFNYSLVSASPATIAKQYYTGQPIVPGDGAVNLVVGGVRLKQGKDYTITCVDNQEVGRAKATLTGIGKYKDSKVIEFTIAKRPLSKVKIDLTYFVPIYQYDGERKTQKLSLYVPVTNDEDRVVLKENVDYVVDYTSNLEVGTAKVIFRGAGNFTGTKTQTFKISKLDIMSAPEDFRVVVPSEYEYVKGGIQKQLKQDIKVYYKDQLLTLNREYSLQLKNYAPKAANDAQAAYGTIKVKGKKNFIGSRDLAFQINRKDLAAVSITAKDVLYRPKRNNFKSKPVLTDSNNKKLAVNKDYSSAYRYYADGRLLSEFDEVPAGTTVTVEVPCMEYGMYKGSISYDFRVVERNITSAKVICQSDRFYVTYKGELLTEGVDYEIVSRELNAAATSYKVQIRGLGTYGNLKKATVRRK